MKIKKILMLIILLLLLVATVISINGCEKYEDPRHIPGKLALVYVTPNSDLFNKLDNNYIFIDTINGIYTSVNEYRINLHNGWFISNEVDSSMVLSDRFVKEIVDSLTFYGVKPKVEPSQPITKPAKFFWLKTGINGVQQIRDSIDSGKIASIIQ